MEKYPKILKKFTNDKFRFKSNFFFIFDEK